jgi:phosphate transport system substrate-binding protein
MTFRRISSVAAAVAVVAGVAACGSSSSGTHPSSTTAAPSGPAATINGSGSTLAAPIYMQWASTLKNDNLTVNYNPVGSGAGQTELASGVTNFAGSDPSLKPADVAKFTKGTPLQFPVAFGAITVSYNLSGVKSGLKLDGPVIAQIFMGKIKTWDDPAIKALNPGMSLPSTSITVVHRSDSSGTTQGFTTFLSDVDPAWKSAVGEGKDVVWPTGTGAKGNAGVAAAVHQTAGSVGYVEQAYALVNGFTYAAVKNSAGTYVLPTIPNTSAAANGITVPANLGISTINSPNAAAYPIVSQTFLMTYKDPCKAGASSTVASGIKRWLTYAFGAGQKTLGAGSGQLPYAPLPADLVSKNEAQLATMTCNGSPIS